MKTSKQPPSQPFWDAFYSILDHRLITAEDILVKAIDATPSHGPHIYRREILPPTSEQPPLAISIINQHLQGLVLETLMGTRPAIETIHAILEDAPDPTLFSLMRTTVAEKTALLQLHELESALLEQAKPVPAQLTPWLDARRQRTIAYFNRD